MINRLAMHQEWFDKNQNTMFLESRIVMQELLAMCRQYKAERNDAMEFVCGVANDVNTLSTRPKDTIRFSDLVYTIQVWGDNANERLKKKENNNG